MKITATEEQIKQIAANAVNAAEPMGLGFLHYTPKVFEAKDFTCEKKGLFLDYVEGRMTKLNIRREGDEWEFPSGTPRVDYQSWCIKYPTYADLIKSVIP
jgi:hypothetical protein